MTDNLAGKSVPWDAIQKFIEVSKTNQNDLERLIDSKTKDQLDVSDVEAGAALPMVQVYRFLQQTLNENGVINEKELEKNKMEILMNAVFKIEESFISQTNL